MERKTALANLALFLEAEALIDSRADAYICGIAGAKHPWKIAYIAIKIHISCI